MIFSATHADYLAKECFRSVVNEHVLKTAEILLAACADVVAQPHVVTEVAKRSGKIVLFGMQWLATIAQAERLRVDTSPAFANFGVHRCNFTTALPDALETDHPQPLDKGPVMTIVELSGS